MSDQRPPHPPAPPYAPPYATPSAVPPGYGPAPAHGAPPAGYGAHQPYRGAPQQAYPGAPPTWSSGPGGAPPAPNASPVLGVLSLTLGVVGAFIALVPFLGALLCWLFLLPALALGIVSLVRRSPGRGLAIGGLIASGLGLVFVSIGGIGTLIFGGWVGDTLEEAVPDPQVEEYSYPSLGVPGLGLEGSSRTDPLPFGSPLTITDVNAGEDVWQMTVSAPTDITAVATETIGTPPVNGAYIAVPIELENIGDEPIDVTNEFDYRPSTSFLTGDGGRADTTYWASSLEMPDITDVGVVQPGDSAVYYEVFDLAAAALTSGFAVVELTDAEVFWGTAPAAG